MFWEYLPSLTKLFSDWLRAERSPVEEKKKEKKKMDEGVARYFTCFGEIFLFFYFLTCGRRSLVSGTQNASS